MKTSFGTVPGSIVAPQGFRAAGVFSDIKRLGTGKGSNKGPKNDLALIVSDVPATAAGLFTSNQVCAAPVQICAERIVRSRAQAIVVNSGNANACTGRKGYQDARTMTRLTGKALGIPEDLVLVGSTGRIGVALPMPNVRKGILAAAKNLDQTTQAAEAAAQAIMTSDTHPKMIAVEFKLSGKTVRLGGICKGAGMIQPGMVAPGKRSQAPGLHATMLCFLTCDAAAEPKVLQECLSEAVAQSFNRITVDGDMSTNDTVLLLANGVAENPRLSRSRRPDLGEFKRALNHVTLELAKMIVKDGEGISRFVTVRVTGARSSAEADAAARSVANSALVKTSWCGGDPNWGRILAALGYSKAKVVEEKVDLAYSLPASSQLVYSLKKGRGTGVSFKTLCAIAGLDEFDLHINLNLGSGRAEIYSADLTEKYVDFNKGDVTDPASLGG